MTCLDMILRLVKPGETVLAGDDLYGGTNRLLSYLGTHGGVDVRHVDTTRVEELLPHLGPGNKSVYSSMVIEQQLTRYQGQNGPA